MMEKKRKAAADIFLEQQQAAFSEMDETLEDVAEKVEADEYEAAVAGPADYDLAASAAPKRVTRKPLNRIFSSLKTSEELQMEKEPTRVRETGFWKWKRVIVPPNAYVIHTRMKIKDPVTIGLGLSFRYNPYTDAYMVVPAAMQTIGVVANCISKEKQGINILAYVQWQIDDFSLAYRKLDFSDTLDPLGIVNAQLREQAEAAVKDKISTMSVEDVLTDKAPIIKELTTRLKMVAEGLDDQEVTSEGLGIKIVTVQIREALVSSTRLWNDLQAPYRNEQQKTARISHLTMKDEIGQKELETRKSSETREAETMVEIERTKQSKHTESVELRLKEESQRFIKEQASIREKIQLEEQTTLEIRESEQRLSVQENNVVQANELEKMRLESEKTMKQANLRHDADKRLKTMGIEQALHELSEDIRLSEENLKAEQKRIEHETLLKTKEADLRLLEQKQTDVLDEQTLEARLGRGKMEHQVSLEQEKETTRLQQEIREKQIGLDRKKQEVRNLINDNDLLHELINRIPELAANMPEIHELKVLQTGNADPAFDSFTSFIARMMALAENLGIPRKSKGK